MKYAEYDITFSEIPGKVSLTLSISGCANNCIGCHSPHLRENIGTKLDFNSLNAILKEYQIGINSIVFLGGDQYKDLIIPLLKEVKKEYPNLKLCLYSGAVDIHNDIKLELDYYKVGPYIEKFGSLESKTTNQKFYERNNNEWVDTTHKFWN